MRVYRVYSLDKANNGGDNKKWSDTGCILKYLFYDGLDVKYRRKRGIKDDSNAFLA